jgi:hypothetical protein
MMLFRREFLDGIAAGDITCAFRRWRRPTVKENGSLSTPVGVLQIDALIPIDEAAITDASARRAGFDGRDSLMASLGEREGQLYCVEFRLQGPDPRVELREQNALDLEARREITERLSRLDAAAVDGAWTRPVLDLIANRPGVRAAELAEEVGMDLPAFKRRVRKLKALGLTESLDVGYRLSPRGNAWMRNAA